MYHTEGFLDKHTYFNKGHIWSFAMAQRGSLCYFWCVLEKGLACGEEEFRQRLAAWFRQELPACLEKGSIAIQKELNRFGVLLENLRASYGGLESPVLHLFFRGELYVYGADKGGYRRFNGQSGIYLTPAMWAVAEIREYVMQVLEDYAQTKRNICPEEFGNCLKTHMLRAMSEEKLERSYFLMWKEKYDF